MTEIIERETRATKDNLLDPEVLAQYSLGLFQKVARLYLDITPPMVQEAQSALGRGDAVTIRQICHALKSSSANVGAMEYSALCRELEAAARDENLATVSTLLPRFAASHEAIVEALENHLEELRSEWLCQSKLV